MTAMQIAGLVLLIPVVIGGALALYTRRTARQVLAALPQLGRAVDAGGVTFNVYEEGEGPPVLLIHGLAGHMRHFTYGMVKQLARQHRVIVIDRPGSGHSVRPSSSAADISVQAAAIASLIDKLRLGPVFVSGHSLGGAIALALALEHPHCVSGLALVAPLTHYSEEAGHPAAFRALMIKSGWLRTLVAWTLAVPGTIARRDAVLGQVFGPEAVPDGFAVKGGGLMSLCPHQFISASRDMQAVPARLPAISSRYHELRIPVHVLFAPDDRILDWQVNGKGLVDKVPGAQLTLVEGGHMLPVTQPDLTADFVRAAALRMHGRTAAEA